MGVSQILYKYKSHDDDMLKVSYVTYRSLETNHLSIQ
jgi:hypothetical protein